VAPTRWGFLGAGFVATNGVAPALHRAEGATLQAVAARDLDRAQALGGLRSTRSYAEVIDSDDVDAIYLSLTNDVHEHWVVAALAAGKHVLCEKPLTLDAASVARIADAARRHDRQVVEALWYRWHPRTRRTRELLAEGVLGDVQRAMCTFRFSGIPTGNYRLDPARGGGALLDVGPYTVDAAMMALGGSIEAITTHAASVRRDVDGHGLVDVATEATLSTGTARAEVSVGIDAPSEQRFEIVGSDGVLSWPGDEVFTVWRSACSLVIERPRADPIIETYPVLDPYVLMIEQTQRAFAGVEPSVMPLADSLRLAGQLDAIAAAVSP
jgi:D-xylose 1-dehydrogenase (NADP+, D-xylono-1,5-lactone-forming)